MMPNTGGTGHAVVVPRLNSVDDSYVLLEWLVPDGAPVAAGQPIAVVETTKTAVDIVADRDGALVHLVAAPSECRFGDHLATIDPGPPTGAAPMRRHAPPAGSHGPVRITDRARQLAETLSIEPAELAATGLTVIRERDLLALAAARTASAPPGLPLSRPQMAVSAAVQRSHREIPAAYAGLFADVDAASAFAQRESRASRCLIGHTEILVYAIARQFTAFPHLFGTLCDDNVIQLPGTADVGVTLDLGAGLFVPVLRDVAEATHADLGRQLMRLRRAAMTGTFTAADLGRPGIVLALNGAVDVAVPIVLPPNVVCVSLSRPQRTLDLDDNGVVRVVHRVHLGMSYDHRVVNGREAGLFLRAVKAAVEAPEGT
jgi:2-oxoglutarate dehydrogenase E2 component (dihydrolipoamide succinyltransferase)